MNGVEEEEYVKSQKEEGFVKGNIVLLQQKYWQEGIVFSRNACPDIHKTWILETGRKFLYHKCICCMKNVPPATKTNFMSQDKMYFMSQEVTEFP